MNYIDSHQHFWKLSRGDYEWLTPQFAPLYKDFLPDDLTSTLQQNNINGTILVQAAATIAETHFLLQLAEQNAFILGVVGWLDMLAVNAPQQLEQLASHQKFCGIRPMLQDIPDINWLLQKELAPSLHALQKLNCTFDALVTPKHLPMLLKFVERYPDLRIVIDHAAKPNIKDNEFDPWATHMKQLAEFPNVFCKLSGLITEAGSKWSWQQLIPYIAHLFEHFSATRLMWGSDFPVLNLASDYSQWYSFSKNYIQTNAADDFDQLFSKTANEFYLSKLRIL